MSDFKNMEVASSVLQRVDDQVALLAKAENGLERGYAHLGWLILEVSELQYWRVHHDSFRDYLQAVSVKSGRTLGRIQQYFLAVRDLSDTFNNAQLESIGITKALELRKAKDYALVLPDAVVKAALDATVTVRELRKLIRTTILRIPEAEAGDWLDLEMEFMVSPEERATIEDAIRAARHCDPVTKSTISSSAQMKDIMMKFAQEFLGTYPANGV